MASPYPPTITYKHVTCQSAGCPGTGSSSWSVPSVLSNRINPVSGTFSKITVLRHRDRNRIPPRLRAPKQLCPRNLENKLLWSVKLSLLRPFWYSCQFATDAFNSTFSNILITVELWYSTIIETDGEVNPRPIVPSNLATGSKFIEIDRKGIEKIGIKLNYT